MPIQRLFSIDLESDEICNFLKDHSQREYDYALGEATSIQIDEYYDTNKRKELKFSHPTERCLNAERDLTLHTRITKKYEILETSTNMQVSFAETYTRVDHALSLSLYALLLIKKNLNKKLSTQIENVFENYRPGEDDVDGIEQKLVRAGVEISDYQVFLSFKLKRNDGPTSETGHDDEFRRNATGSELNRIKQICEEETCSVPDLDLDQTGRTQQVSDPNIPDDGLQQIGDIISAGRECEGLVPTEHRIGTLFQYPEWKIKWEVTNIRIGRCTIVKTKLPILYTRTTKKVLYAFVLSPSDTKQLLERLFVSCMKDSAIVGGLLLLITGGNFATALTAFKISMKACLSSRVPDSIKRCLIPDLAILTDRGTWTKV